jgi:hypothetical protein
MPVALTYLKLNLMSRWAKRLISVRRRKIRRKKKNNNKRMGRRNSSVKEVCPQSSD